MQPYPRRQNSLRGEKKKQTSRRNLGVKWIVGSATFAAIAFIWQRLSGRPMLELFRATLSQRRRQRQLPFEDQSHGLAEWDRHARAEPGEAAWACYRGTVGLVARVHGPGGGSGRPRRRVATRVSILSGIEKKDDIGIPTGPEFIFVDSLSYVLHETRLVESFRLRHRDPKTVNHSGRDPRFRALHYTPRGT